MKFQRVRLSRKRITDGYKIGRENGKRWAHKKTYNYNRLIRSKG